jgi:hypothetical protein
MAEIDRSHHDRIRFDDLRAHRDQRRERVAIAEARVFLRFGRDSAHQHVPDQLLAARTQSAHRLDRAGIPPVLPVGRDAELEQAVDGERVRANARIDPLFGSIVGRADLPARSSCSTSPSSSRSIASTKPTLAPRSSNIRRHLRLVPMERQHQRRPVIV